MRVSATILFVFFTIFTRAQSDAAKSGLNQFVDAWHLAAAQADSVKFFDKIDDDGIYIGTADSERWSKTDFIKFAGPYFKRGKAWDFKPYDRAIFLSADGSYAWFSELLTTWMGVCRGSGIIVKTSNGWKIKQYHLSVTVPNEIIGDFIKLVDGFDQKRSK